MNIFSHILLNNIAPVFFIVALGYAMEKMFGLDIDSFSKANFYIFIPALVLVEVYGTELELDLLQAGLFALLLLAALELLARGFSRLRGYGLAAAGAVKNAVMFYNAGNFGLPLIALLFAGTPHAGFAMSIQIMVLTVQILTVNSLAFFYAGQGQMDLGRTIRTITGMPVIYAAVLGVLLKVLPLDVSEFFLWPAFLYLREGLIPVALLTLGIQLSLARIDIRDLDIYLVSLLRLIGGPLLAYLLLLVLSIEGVMAQVLFISSGVPSAVNTALVAVEFNNKPDLASQLVMTTTLLSAVTLAAVIYLAGIIF